MKYFTELLESYSKLKKRKLKLLSEAAPQQLDPKAEQLAQQLISQVKPGTPVQVPGENTQLTAGEGENQGRIYYNGFGAVQTDVSQGEGYVKFVQHLSDGEATQDTEGGEEGMLPEDQIPLGPGAEADLILSEQPNVDPETKQNILESIVNTNELLQELKKRHSEEFKRLRINQYERHLTDAAFSITKKVGQTRDEWNAVGQFKDPEVMLGVAKNVEELSKILTKDKLTDKDAKILSQFQISGDNIAVRANSQQALVFKSNSLLLTLTNLAKKKFAFQKKYTLDKYKINPKARAAGVDNAFRGVFLEDIRMIACLANAKNKTTSIKKFIQEKYKAIGGNLANLARSTEQWIANHAKTAIDADTYDLIGIFESLAGKDGEALIRAAFAQAKETVARGAAFIVTKGGITKHGRRQDTEEVYTSFESAKKGLMGAGVREDEINSGKKIKQITLQEALTGKTPEETETNLKLAKASGNFTEGQLNGTEPVYTAIVSLKNYLNISKEVTVGTTTRSSNANFVLQDYGGKLPQDEVQPAQAFYNKYLETTGATPEQVADSQQFHKECFGVWDKVANFAQADVLYVTAKNGRTVIQKKSIEELAKNIIGTLQGSSDHKEITDEEKSVKAKLFNTCQRYLDGREGKEGARERIVAYASLLGSNSRIAKGIRENDPAARQYLAVRLFNSGASVDDGLYADFKSLNTNEAFSFYQNDIMLDVVKSVHDGDGRWEIVPQSNGFEFVKKGTQPEQKVRLSESTEGKLDQATGKMRYSIKTSCSLSRSTLEANNRLQQQRSSTKIEGNKLVEMFIETQKKILQTLMSLQKESVVK